MEYCGNPFVPDEQQQVQDKEKMKVTTLQKFSFTKLNVLYIP